MAYGENKSTEELYAAVEDSRRSQQKARRHRINLLSRYVGDSMVDWGTDHRMSKSGGKIVTNNLFTIASLFLDELASGEPRAHISTSHTQHEAFALHFASSLNRLLGEIGFAHENRLCVLEAFFSPIAACKIYRSSMAAHIAGMDSMVEEGLPYAAWVSFDDLIYDAKAKSVRELEYIVHEYRYPLELLKGNPRFDPAVTRKLTAHSPDYDQDRAEDLTREQHLKEYRESVVLCEVTLPFEGKVCTYVADDWRLGPLHEYQWTGPEGGPWEFLQFANCPDNLFAPSPGSILEPIDITLNSLWRKLIHQAKRSKNNLVYAGGAEKDGLRVAKSMDGESIKVNNPESLKMINWQGVDQAGMSVIPFFKNELNKLSGNAEMRAGASASSPTATQDKILMGAQDNMAKAREQRVSDFLRRVFRKLGHLLWEDSSTELSYTQEKHGYKADKKWRPNQPEDPGSRVGKFMDYNFAIEPYTYRNQSPSDKWAFIMQMVNNPLILQSAMQQGIVLDVQELLQTAAEMNNVHELNRIFRQSMPPQTPRLDSMEMRQSPVTERHNVRHNAPPDEMQQMQEMMTGAGGGQGGSMVA